MNDNGEYNEEECVGKVKISPKLPSPLTSDSEDIIEANLLSCLTCHNIPRDRILKLLISCLPFGMKSDNPAADAGSKADATSKPTPAIQVLCQTHTHTPIQSVHQHVALENPERMITNYDFDETFVDPRSYCQNHSSNFDSCCPSHLQIVCSRTHTSKCSCKKIKPKKPNIDVACQQSLLEQAWEYLQSLIFTHKTFCPRCLKFCQERGGRGGSPSRKPSCPKNKPPTKPCPNTKRSSTKPSCPNSKPPCPNSKPPCPNSKPPCPYSKPPCPNSTPPCPNSKPPCPNSKPPCPNSKPPCPNSKPPCPNSKPPEPNPKPSCLKTKPPEPNPKPSCLKTKSPGTSSKPSCPYDNPCDPKPSSDSKCCKESLIKLAQDYLKSLITTHKTECPRCASQEPCYDPKESPSFLHSMLDQAWSYLKPICDQHTSEQQDAPKCPPPAHPEPPKHGCNEGPPGILKHPSGRSKCSCDQYLISSQNPAASAFPVPATCNHIPVCHSKEEGTHEHKSCYTPCCVHNSQGVQLSYTSGSHSKTCCLSQLSVEEQEDPLSTEPCQDPPEIIEGQLNENSSSTYMLGQEIMGYNSGTNCKGPCALGPVNTKIKPENKPGFSLTVEPKDHSFSTKPMECKHSQDSLKKIEVAGAEPPMPPMPPKPPEPASDETCDDPVEQTVKPDRPVTQVGCKGGCSRCNEFLTAQMYGQPEPEPLQNEEFETQEENYSEDKDGICDEGCDCLTCMEHFVSSEYVKILKDPHNYRYYY